MSKISIVILAAGLGTRMKSTTPKVMFQLCGLSMIEHTLRQAYLISDDVNVVLYHQKELIQKHIIDKYPKTKIHTQDLLNYPGTAGALKNLNFKNDKIVITCGDMPLVKSDELLKISELDADVIMSSFICENPFGYGRVIKQNNQVLKIVEQKDANEDEKCINEVNAGCYCFTKDALNKILPLIKNENAQKEYYLTDAIKIANELNLKCKSIDVNETNFMGINDKYQLSVAEEIMQNEIKKELMKNGVVFRLPKTSYIDAQATFEGECIIEENVSIISKTHIKNSTIKSSSIIEQSFIENSTIGPMARIRPNSSIKDSKIGNFVEIKKSTLNGVKAGHLSYLGDCEIDSGTNVGCGTITCNYDGLNKYKTVIGKNVFIGSDTQLIAPVNIEDNVLIAAGSTITKDVKKGDLAISRQKQTNKAGFFYKFFIKEKDA